MFLSQIEEYEIKALTVEQMSSIVFRDCEDDGGSAPIALLLGGPMKQMPTRTKAAFKLYQEKRVSKIVSTGCASRVRPKESYITQGQYMANLLMEWGVPEEDIILDHEARTTVENMLYSQIQINRNFRNGYTCDVVVVTSEYHLQRSRHIAKVYMPEGIRIYGCPAQDENLKRNNWFNEEDMMEAIFVEIKVLRRMILAGQIDDIEF